MDALKTIITWAYNQGGLIAEGRRVFQLMRYVIGNRPRR
jgi:hypothetical protein